MAEPKVHFVEQTQAEYDTSLAHSSSTIYFCTDTKKIYKGDDEYCASSGGGNFVVTYTENSGTYTADKTYAEISAAIEAGKNISAVCDKSYFELVEYAAADDTVIFVGFDVGSSQTPTILRIYHYVSNNEDEISFDRIVLAVQS